MPDTYGTGISKYKLNAYISDPQILGIVANFSHIIDV